VEWNLCGADYALCEEIDAMSEEIDPLRVKLLSILKMLSNCTTVVHCRKKVSRKRKEKIAWRYFSYLMKVG